MSTLCTYENYLRDRYVLGQSVHYTAGSNSPKPKSYDREGNEYTWSDEAGDYVRQVGGPGGGRTIRLSEVEKAESEQAASTTPPNEQVNADSGQHGAEKKPRDGNVDGVKLSSNEFSPRNSLYKVRYPSTRDGVDYTEGLLYDSVIGEAPTNDRIGLSDSDWKNLVNLGIQTGVLDSKGKYTPLAQALASNDKNAKGIAWINLAYNNPAVKWFLTNFDDGMPHKKSEIVGRLTESGVSPSKASAIFSSLKSFFSVPEDSPLLPRVGYVTSDGSLKYSGLQSIDDYPGVVVYAISKAFENGRSGRVSPLLTRGQVKVSVSDDKTSVAPLGLLTVVRDLYDVDDVQKILSGFSIKHDDVLTTTFTHGNDQIDFKAPNNKVLERILGFRKRDDSTSNPEARQHFDDSGLGLPGKSDVALKPGVAENKDAAYFVRRDLEATPKSETEERVEEVDEVSEIPSSEAPQRDDDATLERKAKEALGKGEPLRKKATRLRSKAKDAALKGRKEEAAGLRKQADEIEAEARKYIDEATNAGVELKNRRAEASQQPVPETKEPIKKPEVPNSSVPDQQPEPVAETVADGSKGVDETGATVPPKEGNENIIDFRPDYEKFLKDINSRLQVPGGNKRVLRRLKKGVEETLKKDLTFQRSSSNHFYRLYKNDLKFTQALLNMAASFQGKMALETSQANLPKKRASILSEGHHNALNTLREIVKAGGIEGYSKEFGESIAIGDVEKYLHQVSKELTPKAFSVFASNLGIEFKSRKAKERVEELLDLFRKPRIDSAVENKPSLQNPPAKPRPERWTPLKSKMNDDDRRVIENTRKRLNYGLSELAWRLGNAKEKGDVQRVKQLVATAANHYLEQARRAYRSHGGTEALAAFDEALGGDGLTVGQLRDRVVDKFRKIAQMEANDLFKFAGERLDEFESFAETDREPIANKKIYLNSIRDKNGKWEDLDNKDSEVVVEDGKPTTLFPDEYFGRRMGSERGLADAVRRALKSMTRKGEYRDSFENGAEYAVPKYNIGTSTRMGRFLAHGYKDSLDGMPVSRDDYSEQRYQELLEKFPTDRESRRLNNLFNSNNREVNKLIKENEDEYKKSENKSKVVQRVVDGIRDLLSGGQQNGSAEAPPSENLRSRATGEVLETGGADRPSDGGDGRNLASVIAEETKKSDIPESRVREELDAPRQSSTSTPQEEEKPDWLVALESQEDLKPVSKGEYNPNAKPYSWKANFPETEDELREYWREHVDGGEDEEVSFGSDGERISVGEQSGDAPMTPDELRRFAQLRHGRELRKSLGLSEHFSEKELKELQEPSEKRGRGRPSKKTAGAEPLGKDVIQDRIAEALGIPSDTSKRKSSRRPKKNFDPDSIKDDVEKAVSIRDADRSQLSAESIDSMTRIAQSVSKKYGVDGLRDFMRRIDVVPLAKSRPKLLQELKDFLEDYRLNRYKATVIRNM